MPDQPPVGIDLGTTFSVVAHLDRDARPWTVLNSEGDLTTPSVVFFDRTQVIVGKEAVKEAEFEPESIAQYAKRDMGRRRFHKAIGGEYLPPEVVQAHILRKLKADAELKLGPIRQAVVTVPAYFNEPRRKATQDAGRIAGLDVLDIINEPTAAAISYGVQQGFLDAQGESRGTETVLVYDLGGGTFDVTLMQIDGRNYNAVATAGDVYLGGIDWNGRIADYVGEEFIKQHDVDPRTDASAEQRLMQEVEDAKRALTAREEVTIRFAFDGRRVQIPLTRVKFEELTGDLLDRTLLTTRKVLREAKKSWGDVTRLLLVGGSTRMPAVAAMLEQESGLEVDRSLSPDEAVAHGAAIYAGLLMSPDAPDRMSVQNVNSHDLGVLGVEQATGRKRRQLMIPRNTRLPANKKQRFPTFRDNQRAVDVRVIEGGDDSGSGATNIGRCTVVELPKGLKAGTPVDVTFHYTPNGRLTIEAFLPTIDRRAKLEIERAAGMSDAELAEWEWRLTGGVAGRSGQGGPTVAEAESEVGDRGIGLAETEDREDAASDRPQSNEPAAQSTSMPPEPPAVVSKEKLAASQKDVARPPVPNLELKQSRPQQEPTIDKPPTQPESKRGRKDRSSAPTAPKTDPEDSAAPPPIPASPSAAASNATASPPIPDVATERPVDSEPDDVGTTVEESVAAGAFDFGDLAAESEEVDAAAFTFARKRKPADSKSSTGGPPPVKAGGESSAEKSSAATEADAETEDEEEEPRARTWKENAIVVGVSTLLHAVVLLIMWFIVIESQAEDPFFGILSSHTVEEKEQELVEIPQEQPEVVDKQLEKAKVVNPLLADTKQQFNLNINKLDPAAHMKDEQSDAPAPKAPTGEMGGRSEAGRTAMVERFGGTKASEASVRFGLNWLKRHQHPDGSWSFDHRVKACDERCKKQHGTLAGSRVGATAMALIAYMGAGHTYSDGDYREVVEKAIKFLISKTRTNGDMRDIAGNPGMYIQGLGTMALCEALAMSRASLKPGFRAGNTKRGASREARRNMNRLMVFAAQAAVVFIQRAQGANGGWAYQPRTGGDTSVVGWQVMALVSAKHAGLKISPKVLSDTGRWLDFVQSAGGAKYGYTTAASQRPSMTAVGLLCRMYLGWRPDRPALKNGVDYISAVAPAKADMYYNYYATQVMFQWGGKHWEKWNAVMRDQLVKSQVKEGHAAGSWDVSDRHGGPGGRLYMTCLCVMTLEVYYRHLPIYEYRFDQRTRTAKK